MMFFHVRLQRRDRLGTPSNVGIITVTTSTSSERSTASAEEIAKFTRLADAWWDPHGAFKPLHKFNPERIRFIRDRLARHFCRDITRDRPFAGLKLLDIGCGGG